MAASSEDDGAIARMEQLALERVVFFTDAVFAISITLLVLELRLPELPRAVSNHDLTQALLALAPHIFSYLLSFAVIGLYWLAHWRRFHEVVAVNEGFARINLLLLVWVALIPFPTAVLGSHGDRFAAVALYALVLSAAGIVGSWSWFYAHRHGLARGRHSPRWVWLNGLRGLLIPAVFLASIPLALVSPSLAELSWVVIFPLQAIILRAMRRTE